MSDINVFILVNLGCEMLYVIDQRLRAQHITLEKSVQVLKDITGVLLDSTFIERLIIGSRQKATITEEHCKFILNDLACCSLMRLDESSMSKLWDLITMVFKWQLEVAREPIGLLETTYRHLDGISQLHPSVKKTMLIDCTKTTLGNFWDEHNASEKQDMFDSIKNWFLPFTTKISIFIRMGFQNLDGTFNTGLTTDQFLQFSNNAGENIYLKHETLRTKKSSGESSSYQFKGLAEQLNIVMNKDEDMLPVTTGLYFDDVNQSEDKTAVETENKSEFVQLRPVHRATTSWESVIGGKSAPITKKDLQKLLNSKLV